MSENPEETLRDVGEKGLVKNKLLCWLAANDGSLDKATLKNILMKEFNDCEVNEAKDIPKKLHVTTHDLGRMTTYHMVKSSS